MSHKIIKELFLFPNYKVIVFAGNAYYYTVKSGSVCYSPINKNADAIDTDFANSRINVYNTKMLGKLSQLSDSKLKLVFKKDTPLDVGYKLLNNFVIYLKYTIFELC